MEPLVKEYYSGRIKVHTVYADGAYSCEITVEGNVLIGVCKQSPGL